MTDKHLHGCWVTGDDRTCEDGTKGCSRSHPLDPNWRINEARRHYGQPMTTTMVRRAEAAPILDHKAGGYNQADHEARDREDWETIRARSRNFRPGHDFIEVRKPTPVDMTKRERMARRLIDSALTTGAVVHYMGVYARSVPR